MKDLTARLTLPAVLAFPRSTGEYTVDAGASDGHVGYDFLLEQENMLLKPMDYLSRSLNSAERNYNTTHK